MLTMLTLMDLEKNVGLFCLSLASLIAVYRQPYKKGGTYGRRHTDRGSKSQQALLERNTVREFLVC